MNKAYRIVWNACTNTWTAVQENAKAKGKSSSGRVSAEPATLGRLGLKSSRFVCTALASALMMTAGYANAGPGIFINDGNDAGCIVTSDESSRRNALFFLSNNNLEWAAEPTSGGTMPSASAFQGKCTPGDAATQINRALFYGNAGGAGSKHLSLGGRLDVNSGIIGLGDRAAGNNSIRIGSGNTLQAANSQSNSVAIGNDVETKAALAVGIGPTAKANGQQSVAVGNSVEASGNFSVAIGTSARANAAQTVALGNNANAAGEDALAIGRSANAQAKDSIAFGRSSQAAAKGVAIGSEASAAVANSVALGSGTTAVAATNQSGTKNVNGLNYTYVGDSANSSVTVGNRQIKQVGAGEVSAASTDAINGSQLYATQNVIGNIGKGVATNLGGGAALKPDGTFTAPTYNLTDANGNAVSKNNVGDALNVLDSRLNTVGGGFQVAAATGTTQTVKPGNTLKFIDGTNTTTEVSTDGAGVTTVKINATGGGAAVPLTSNAATGQVNAPAAADANKAATAGSVATAINTAVSKSGFNVQGGSVAGGSVTGAATTKVNNGSTVKLQAGKNIALSQSGADFTFATAENLSVTSVTATDAAGNKTVTNGSGVTITPAAAGSSPVRLTTSGLDNGGNKITNLTSGNVAAGDNSAVTGGAVNTAINTAINTAVTDLKDAGFKIGADSGADDTVKLGETVKYAGDANIKTTVTNNQIGFKLADSITVGPASGGSPVTVDGSAGTVTGLTNKTWNPAGIVSGRAATEDQLKAVANQVNSSATHYYSVNDGGGAHGGNFNNDGATGLNALAAGVGASAQDNDAVAIGSGTIAQGNGSIAIGAAAEVSGATGAGGIAIGAAATAKNGGTAVGSGADTGNGTALIPGLPNRLNNNLALGDSARVKNDTNFNVALGSLSTAGDADLTAAAYKPNATSVIAGDINEAGVKYGEVSLGGDTSHFMSGSKMYRRLTNLAAGSADTDAVNVSQLKAVQAALQDQAPVAYTKADGTKVYKHTDGNFYDAPNGAGNQVAAADVITSLQNAAGSTTAPTTLANVKDNLADTAAAVTNPTGNDRTTLSANKGHNAATVNDVLNAGFTVQGNGVDEDFVTHGDTVNFVNGQGTVANVSSTGGVTTVKFDTPMTYVDTAGTPATTPSNKVNLVGTGGPVTLGNVAAGAVNATSTDAVNGSQLYKTANSTATHLGGGSAVQADGSISAPTYTLANATGTPTNYSNVGDALTALNARTNAANAGWKFQVNSGAAETIKPNDTVGFKDGTNIAITNNGKDITIATKPNLTADSLTINNGPVINGNGISTNGKNIDMGNNGKITNLTSGNVAAGDNSAVTGGAVNTAINTAINTAVTDLKDAGFKIGADSGADDTVKLGETVKYAGDANIKTTVTNNQIGFKLADSITVGPASGGSPVTVDGSAGTVTGLTNKTWNPAGIVSGRAATEDQLKAVANQVNSSATHYYSVNDGGGAHGGNFNNDGATGLNALAAGVGASAQDNDAVAIGSGTIAQGNGSIAIGAAAEVSGATGAGGIAIGAAATAKNGGTAVGSGADTGNGTALIPGLPNRLNNNLALGDSARVKNDTNFNVALGSLSTAGDADLTAAAYKPNATSVIAGDINEAGVKYGEVSLGGDTSHFMSGSKMYRRLTNLAAGSADTDAVNVSQLKAVQAALQDQAPVAYTKADGTKVYKHTDGNFYDAPNGAGNQVAAADVITSLQNAAGSTTAPTTLANVKDNLADTAAAVTNPTGNDRTTLSANKGHNAATVNDVLNAGFTVQGNGVDEDFVTHGDTVNFVNGQGTVANVSSTGGVTTVKFDTPMTYVDTAGTPATTPSNKVNLVGTGGPVTLGNVAAGAVNATSTDAVNGSQLFATNQNVANNAANIAKGINFGGTTGSKNYALGDTINVKGDSNIISETVAGGAQLKLADVLNVGQAAPVKIDGDKGEVSGLSNTTLGGSDFAQGKRAATEEQLNAAQDQLVNVLGGNAANNGGNISMTDIGGTGENNIHDAIKAVNATANLPLTFGGDSGKDVERKPGTKLNIVGGQTDAAKLSDGNIGVVANGSDKLEVKLAKDLAVDSVKAGDTTVNTDGVKVGDVNLTKAGLNNGGNKITNVAAGTDDTDAVNVAQLNKAAAAAKTEVVQGDNIVVTQNVGANGQTIYKVATDKNLKVDSVTAGDTVMNNDGVKVGDDVALNKDGLKAGDVNLTKAGLNNGGNKITNVAAGTDDTDAVNVSQLKQAATASKTEVVQGKNIVVTEKTGDKGQTVYEVATDKDLDVDSVKAGDTTVNNDGVKVGDDVALNKDGLKAGKVNLTKDGLDNAGNKVTNVADGDINANSKDAVNGSQLYATNQNVANNAATIAKGINFGGTTGSNNYALGDTINVKGDSNIISETVAGGTQLKLADEISVKTVNADTFKTGDTVMNNDGMKVGDKVALNKDGLTAGNTVVNNDGVTIAAPTENNPNNQVKLSPVGLNNGGQRITNVAPGKDGTDAANVNQLIGLGNELQNNINQVGKKAYAGVAGAIAQGSIPQVTSPGETGIGVGSGYYGGQSAMAIGVSAMSDGGNWIVKGNFSANTDGHVGVGVGALYKW